MNKTTDWQISDSCRIDEEHVNEICIPTDIIGFLANRYQAEKIPVDILYDVYLENYLINIGKKSN